MFDFKHAADAPAALPAPTPPPPVADDGLKPWWASRTMVGIVVMMLAPIANMIGIQITEPDRVILAELLTTAVVTVAGIFAIVGRLLAARPLR